MRLLNVCSIITLALSATVPVIQASPLPIDDSTTAQSTVDDSKLHSTSLKSMWDPNDYDCKPTESQPRPVVLVHGVGSYGPAHWFLFASTLKKRGHCVFILNHGALNGFDLAGGLDSIENSSKQLSDFVKKVLTVTGASKVNIVAHSGGTAVVHYYLLKLNGGQNVDRYAGLGGMYRGTDIFGFTTFLQQVGLYKPLRSLVEPFCKSCPELHKDSDFMKALNAHGDTVPDVKYLNIVTRLDEIVSPKESGFLLDDNLNVRNVYLQDLCAVDLSEHYALVLSPVVFHAVDAHFDDEINQFVSCLSAVKYGFPLLKPIP